MEVFIVVLVLAIVFGLIFYNERKGKLDVNKDGKVDSTDVKAATLNTINTLGKTLDVNKDGKIDSTDIKSAVEKLKSEVKAEEPVKQAAQPIQHQRKNRAPKPKASSQTDKPAQPKKFDASMAPRKPKKTKN